MQSDNNRDKLAQASCFVSKNLRLSLPFVFTPPIRLYDTTIGSNVIIITKNIPDYAVVAGVPAKIIKYRFEPKIIARMQELKWWDYNLLGFTLLWDNPLKFLDELESLIHTNTIQPYCPKAITVQ